MCGESWYNKEKTWRALRKAREAQNREEIMIYTFLADGFEEIEALCPIDMLRRAGLEETTIAVHPDPQHGDRLVTGSHGIGVMADRSYTEMAAQPVPDDLEMVILPGGMPGAKHLDGSALVERYLQAADRKGAFMAAICAAPMVLGKRGYLNGKKAVCYPGFEEYLTGAEVCDTAVAVDGNVVTGCGMGAAMAFGGTLIRLMKGAEKEEAILSAILADRV